MGASELEAAGTRWWRELSWLLKKGCPHKFTRRDGGSTGLYTAYAVDSVYTVNTVGIVREG